AERQGFKVELDSSDCSDVLTNAVEGSIFDSGMEPHAPTRGAVAQKIIRARNIIRSYPLSSNGQQRATFIHLRQ
ncbi:MAG: hypothetical protein ACK5QX_03865, partial [bacterium]